VEPDRERVGGHCGQCRQLSNVDPEAEQEDEGCDPAAHRCDLQPVDREAVVETGRAEVVEQPLVHG
jgi:hypothetical protein